MRTLIGLLIVATCVAGCRKAPEDGQIGSTSTAVEPIDHDPDTAPGELPANEMSPDEGPPNELPANELLPDESSPDELPANERPLAAPLPRAPAPTSSGEISSDAPPNRDRSARSFRGDRPGERAPPVEPAPDVSEKEEDDLDPRDQVVKVFYATDREPISVVELGGQQHFVTFYRAPGVAGVAAVVFLLATFFSSRRILCGLMAVVCLGATLWLFQSATLKAQRWDRTANFGDRMYGAKRNEVAGVAVLELGTCDVSLPPDHRVGQVETPSLIRMEFREDPEKHVIIQRTIRLPKDQFYEDLTSVVRKSTEREAFIFIHGYNVGFEHAIRRTAQIAHDLRFDGAPICYSWPSQGGPASYTYDEANVEWAVLQFEQLLRDTRQRSGAQTIHLIAHSMGNRILMQAMDRMAQGHDAEPLFGEVIMAAPDVDAGVFRNRFFPAVAKLANHVTLYASSHDRALLASTKIHGHNRAGLSGENLVVIQGLDTIDASPIDTSLIGHSYYGDNPEMIRDLHTLITDNTPAQARTWLKRVVKEPAYHYWVFDLEAFKR